MCIQPLFVIKHLEVAVNFFLSYLTCSLSVNPISSVFKCVQNLAIFYNHLFGQVTVISFLDYFNILVTGFPTFCPSPCSLFSTVWPAGEILQKRVQLSFSSALIFPKASLTDSKSRGIYNEPQTIQSCLLTALPLPLFSFLSVPLQLQWNCCCFNIPGRHLLWGFTPSPVSHLSSLLTFWRNHLWLHFSFIPYVFIEHLFCVMQCSKILGYSSDSNRQKCLPSWRKRLQIISNAHNKDINSALNLIKKKESLEFFMEDQIWHVSVIKAGLTKKVIFKERLEGEEGVSYSSSVQSLSHVRLCNSMNRSTPGLPVHHQLPKFTQTHVHWVGDAIPPSHLLSSLNLSPLALNLSQHEGLFQWVSSMH